MRLYLLLLLPACEKLNDSAPKSPPEEICGEQLLEMPEELYSLDVALTAENMEDLPLYFEEMELVDSSDPLQVEARAMLAAEVLERAEGADAVYLRFGNEADTATWQEPPALVLDVEPLAEPLYLGQICLFEGGETVSCEAVGGTLRSFVDALSGGGSSERPYDGSCAVLAVAHSLVYTLRKVPCTEAENGDYWKKDFLDKIKRAVGHQPGVGTDPAKLPDGYKAIASGVTCEASVELAPRQEQTWCTDLQARLTAGYDCTVGMRWAIGGGHRVHATSASWNGQMCTVNSTNTGIQGAGSGTDIPLRPGADRIDVETLDGEIQGVSHQFTELERINRMSYLCCK